MGSKKREKKKPPGMGRHAARPSQKTRVRASRLCFRRGLAAQCEGEEACFRPRLGRGAAKEKKAAARRLLSLPARGAQKKRIKKNYYANATTTRAAA